MTNKQLFAKIRISSKYFWQNEYALQKGQKLPFPVTLKEKTPHGYEVFGGPGGQYHRKDVHLFVIENGEYVCVDEPVGELVVQLSAKLKRTSLNFSDNELAKNDPRFGLPFPVCIVPDADYKEVVRGGPRDYRLDEVTLFVDCLKIS